MFVGHYAVALAAKTAEPRAPLWTYVGACQLLDIGWSGLVMAGIEKMRFAPSPSGAQLDLYFMPYTHSLPGAAIWAAGAAALALVFRLPWRAALLIGLTVFSHWLLDLFVHHPDLELGFGAGKVGLGFWDYPIPEIALEMGLLAITGAVWAANRVRHGRTVWPAALFLAFLTGLQLFASMGGGGDGDPAGFGLTALAAYLLTTAVAWAVDRSPAAKLA